MSLSNVVRVNSNYKIQTTSGGTLTLDTGNNTGTVVVTGDLTVLGNMTTLDTTNTQIKDNIITLNKGETGYGITAGSSGIQISRGTANNDAFFVFDESQTWNDPVSQTIKNGLFIFTTATGGTNGIRSNSIDTNGGDLYLINKGTGVISVSGTSNYEQQVLDYANGLVPIDDDIIPNMRAVTDKIAYSIAYNLPTKLKTDDTEIIVYDNNIGQIVKTFDTFGAPSTSVRLNLNLVTNASVNVSVGTIVTITGSNITNLDGTWTVSIANPAASYFYVSTASNVTASQTINVGSVAVQNINSYIRFNVDGTTVSEIKGATTDFYNIRFTNSSSIGTITNNTDLQLYGSGGGSVRILDNLKMAYQTSPPGVSSIGVKLYGYTRGPGQTGLFFINSSYNDELISKKKAIAFSILM